MSAVPFAALLGLIFFSGASALVYQVLWQRLLSITFGVTVFATSTVLAAFMSGLTLGSLLAPRLVGRFRRPLSTFALAEILIGVSALGTPLALEGAEWLYQNVRAFGADSFAALTLARLLGSFVVLLLPTMLMGMTLPLLCASSLVRGSHFGARLGLLYGINTAGGVCGVLVTGFVLIGTLGTRQSLLLAAAVNLTVGLLALLLARRETVLETPVRVEAGVGDSSTPLSSTQRLVLVVMGISGAATLALEVVWFRILAQFVTATSYAFTGMLASVLAGIAIGGLLAARIPYTPNTGVRVLLSLQLAIAVAVVVSFTLFARSFEGGEQIIAPVATSLAIVFPAALLMGIGFPIALRLFAEGAHGESAAAAARRVGLLYAINTLGAIVGSLAGGFVLSPWLGSRQSLILGASAFALTGIALAISTGSRAVRVGAAVASVTFLATVSFVPDPTDAAFARRYVDDPTELWREEGAQTVVNVRSSLTRKTMYLDGLHQASDEPAMVLLHRVIGHLGMVLHPNPKRVLVVGLGGGATPGAIGLHPDAEITVVELSESVPRGARFFSHINYHVLANPRVRVLVDDGRGFLRFTRERFDVITADIIQPDHAGAGLLYSVEYFELVKRALSEDGYVIQWLGRRKDTQYKLIMRTFLQVFPNATLWYDGNILVGSERVADIAPRIVSRHLANPRLALLLSEAGLDSIPMLRSWRTAGPDAMKAFVGPGPVLTDDRPLMEYFKSLPSDEPMADIVALRAGEIQGPGAEQR
jgi:spermidine synthase